MPMNNPFDNPAFNTTSLTEGLNLMPIQWGLIGELGLFSERGVSTTTVAVERKHNVLTLLPSVARGGEPTQGSVGKRDIRPFIIPSVPHDDVVLPEEVQDVRSFRSENQLATLTNLMAEKLENMAANHDITLEHLRAGAIRGEIVDGDGSTVLYNLHNEFDTTSSGVGSIKQINWTTATSQDLKATAASVLNHIEDNLQGDTWSSTMVLCSPGFWDKLMLSTEVTAAYDRFQEGQFLRQDPRMSFQYAGLEWKQYRGAAVTLGGDKVPMIPDDKAQVVPLGTRNTFVQYNGPADFNETANTIGLRRYAKQAVRRFDRGWDLITMALNLPLCLRPNVLIELGFV